MLAAATGGLAFIVLRERRKLRAAVRVGRASTAAFILYLVAVVLASLLTPRTIVSTGDSTAATPGAPMPTACRRAVRKTSSMHMTIGAGASLWSTTRPMFRWMSP